MKPNTLRLLSSSALLFAMTSTFAATGYLSQTSGQITLAPKDDVLVATTVVNWDPKSSDQLEVKWLAPKGFCQSSIFNIARGNNTQHDVSWSYRTVTHQQTSCTGKWQVLLINTSTAKTLSSAGYVVSPLATQS
ncbi:MAG: hypothetical protein NTV32_00715 [Gammaproteobacteria bacterium]|nr:hypothetical protein [Gammaproteobacteria bacterium]